MDGVARSKMPGEVRLEIVPDATHFFEEPAGLEEVAHRTRRWFQDHLRSAAA